MQREPEDCELKLGEVWVKDPDGPGWKVAWVLGNGSNLHSQTQGSSSGPDYQGGSTGKCRGVRPW